MLRFTHRKLLIGLLVAVGSVVTVGVANAAPPARGDSLLLRRVQQEQGMHLPRRGLSMAQVEKTWGAPLHKLAPRGGGSVHQPVINRWDYAHFIVYFERSHVIHSVLNTPAGNNLHPNATL